VDTAYVSAFFGLAGVAIGGLTSFSTAWLTQMTQLRDKHLEAVRTKRQELFSDFIAEASRLHGDALSHEKDEVTDLVQLYAMVAMMRLVASRDVVNAAERVMDSIIGTYLAPNLSLHEIRSLAQQGQMNFLTDFADACRIDLDTTRDQWRKRI
jgi:hypothetical protein